MCDVTNEEKVRRDVEEFLGLHKEVKNREWTALGPFKFPLQLVGP